MRWRGQPMTTQLQPSIVLGTKSETKQTNFKTEAKHTPQRRQLHPHQTNPVPTPQHEMRKRAAPPEACGGRPGHPAASPRAQRRTHVQSTGRRRPWLRVRNPFHVTCAGRRRLRGPKRRARGIASPRLSRYTGAPRSGSSIRCFGGRGIGSLVGV